MCVVVSAEFGENNQSIFFMVLKDLGKKRTLAKLKKKKLWSDNMEIRRLQNNVQIEHENFNIYIDCVKKRIMIHLSYGIIYVNWK